ncbi:CBS domain-containing protein [Sinorhizobium kostiense]|uniref:CBS domain-containing protein n=1 Tax=Sinorhizobium kostiense TaxID=76747 RepID=A0ABS4QSM7_9HYPH|nr:CBS domain-containing protein [Sinorhizobium kostiense]MBP2233660.1 CBS domain-containing protein [Sinorhizobium kostiense]
MFVGEIVKNKGVGVIAVTPDQTMVEILRMFRANNIGFVVVGSSDGKYLGTLSERDCCNAVSEYGAEAVMMRAVDIMNRGFATCSTKDLLQVAMGIMTERRTRHVLVMDGEDVVGVVSVGDVVKHRLEEAQRTEQDLHDYICGTHYH